MLGEVAKAAQNQIKQDCVAKNTQRGILCDRLAPSLETAATASPFCLTFAGAGLRCAGLLFWFCRQPCLARHPPVRRRVQVVMLPAAQLILRPLAAQAEMNPGAERRRAGSASR